MARRPGLVRRLAPIGGSERGAVVVLFALAVPVLLGIGALAVDVGSLYLVRTELQISADAAALAAVAELPDEDAARERALEYAAKNMSGARHGTVLDGDDVEFGSWDAVSRTFTPGAVPASAVRVTARRSDGNANAAPSFFARVFGYDSVDVATQATAGRVREPVCFMAMHPTRKHTFLLDGAVSIHAPECNIYANSTHANDVVDPKTRDNYVTAKSIQAMGYGHNWLQNLTPPLQYAPEEIPDPLQDLDTPYFAGCGKDKHVINKKIETLSPGVYCNGLTIRESTVTLQPGTYFITRKSLKIEDSTVTGDGVLIVLADEDVALEWSSSVIDISAPTTGAYAGIAIFGHRGDEVDHVFDETVLHIDGVVYVPTGNIDWTNTGSAASTAQWTALIALGFNFHGDGTINLNFDLENPSVPYPAKLNVIPTGKLGLLE